MRPLVSSMETALKTVLVVEDERSLSAALKVKLEGAGFQVVTAENGKKALDVVQKQKIDVIILDLIMPVMNGFDFVEAQQALGMKVPIIVLSNLGQEQDIKRMKALGINSYLIKSDTPISKVVEEVHKKLGTSG